MRGSGVPGVDGRDRTQEYAWKTLTCIALRPQRLSPGTRKEQQPGSEAGETVPLAIHWWLFLMAWGTVCSLVAFLHRSGRQAVWVGVIKNVPGLWRQSSVSI